MHLYIISYIISYHIYISYHIIHHIISYHITSYIISYHIIYHIISYHIISYHIISYHIISYHIISYRIISYIIPYHIIYHISYHIKRRSRVSQENLGPGDCVFLRLSRSRHTASCPILSRSLQVNNLVIRCCTLWSTESCLQYLGLWLSAAVIPLTLWYMVTNLPEKPAIPTEPG